MASIFPGMDPYLEDSAIWSGVHNAMAVYVRDHLQPRLQPRYIAALEERVFVDVTDRATVLTGALKRRGTRPTEDALDADTPEVIQIHALELHESYVTILDRHADQKVVTVIELVGPTKKCAGPGRESYLAKQREVLASGVHLVEIDLVRAGTHIVRIPEDAARALGPYDYLVCVNRAVGLRDEYEVYRRTLREPLPKIRVPLADGDPDVALDLQAVLTKTYDAGVYSDRLDCDRPCVPALSSDDQTWADALIRAAGLGPR